jgi:anti-anti-sigma factor
MDITIAQEQAGTQCRLSLCGEMSIYNAAELKPRLLTCLQDAESLAIDLSEISELDTAGLQLLWLCQQEAALTGKIFTITATSTAAMESIALLRLEPLFNLPPM